MIRRTNLGFAMVLIASFRLTAQVPNPTQNQRAAEQTTPMPIFRIEVVSRTTPAVNYRHRGGSTKIDFQGTPVMPQGKGTATVESVRGVIHVAAELKNMAAPSSFGPEYLTYVLWAVSPDGRPVNMGELTLSDYGMGSTSKIETTSDIQTFGMIVTAEPYYSVTQPSDVVVMENVVRKDTLGVVEDISARYELLPRGTYTSHGRASGFKPILVGKKDPFELYEAENAVQLARIAGADKYASESFQKANDALDQALRYQTQKPGQKPVITMAREAVLRAEDARVIAIRAEKNEFEANERAAALARENAERAKAEKAQQQAELEARQRAQAESERASAERAKAEAQSAAQIAQQERLAAERAKREADEARQAAIAQQQLSAADAERSRQLAANADAARLNADAARLKAEQDQAELRRQLLQQFNTILQTTETARGLIVNMSDVLFDTARYTLKPGAREKLAKVSGIILGHPGLKIEVEGHTDSVGGDEYNMKLSENRANAVREFLVSQGLRSDGITAQGFGKTKPVADNGTAAGRQMNRRVELVVSGEILGTKVSTVRTGSGDR
ncbi:MAG TPA: OmpA family protein [Bryobacteraceae bacterium]|nr:OmpA family protein [Bryobacteraceae bacterium]